ncbi:MAG: hypothetical protein CV088_05760 [Nitrospira sp. LK70]|nr:hypothetical protein [Nitrospira sp. LK70]
MQYLSEDQATQMMGMGYIGEVRQGPDGNLYQYVQGVDGLGNPLGFWRRLKRLARRVVRKALPIAQQFAPFIPGGTAALTAVTPFLKQAGVAGQDGIGALYQAPDGTLYQEVQGVAENEELRGLGEDEVAQMMGMGYIGEVRQGPDGNLYQYVQGVDGLGNPLGFWRRLKRLARRVVRKALPIAQQFAPFIPGGTAALTATTPFLKQAGVAGYEGLDEDEELRGLDEDDELRGLDEDDELRGLDEDEELRGLEADDELQGLAEDDDLRGAGEDQEMQGVDGYIRQNTMSGLEAYVPQEPPQTRWHVTPAQPPEVWKPLW